MIVCYSITLQQLNGSGWNLAQTYGPRKIHDSRGIIYIYIFFRRWEIVKWLLPPWAGREGVSDFYWLKPTHVPSCALCVPGPRYLFRTTRSPGRHRPWLAPPVGDISLRRAWNTNAPSRRWDNIFDAEVTKISYLQQLFLKNRFGVNLSAYAWRIYLQVRSHISTASSQKVSRSHMFSGWLLQKVM